MYATGKARWNAVVRILSGDISKNLLESLVIAVTIVCMLIHHQCARFLLGYRICCVDRPWYHWLRQYLS